MKIDRRTVLIGGGAGIGLIAAFALWPRGLRSDLDLGADELPFGNYLKIGKDGRVTVAVAQAETGQGTWTALPQIVADELGAAWDSIAVEPAPLTGAYGNALAADEGWPKGTRVTAGATSVRAYEQPLRLAAATARAMLVGAAADRWNVDPGECAVGGGTVINGARSVPFHEIAEEAAYRSVPRNPVFRQDSGGRLVGTPVARIDAAAKSNGSWRFASDVRLPGMIYAAARLAPPGGRLEAFDRDAIARRPGIIHVAARDSWVAVAADNWWLAEQALRSADARYSAPGSGSDLRASYDAALADGDGDEWFSSGDYEATVRGLRALTATYYVAPSPHLGLEPLTATARAGSDGLEIWAATQAPEETLRQARTISDKVSLYPMSPGEPAGRALDNDAIPIAIHLARTCGRPVQVTLPQTASQNHDRLSGGALAQMLALPDSGGTIAAWKMRLAAVDGLGATIARLSGRKAPQSPAKTGLEGSIPPYSIPNLAIEAANVNVPFRAGYMRGSPQREFAFFTESFIDELARRAGTEPLGFRMAMLGGNGRLARCLQAATRLAGWDGGGPGSSLGIAGASAFGSHIAVVANATIGENQQIKVHRLVAAVDCGRVVNSGLVTQQVEAAMIWGIAQATVPAAESVAGMARARPFKAIGLPRIADAPDIDVHIIPSSEPAGGVNGLGAIVVAPAIANAVFSGTGRRLRALPFDLSAA